MRTLLFIAISSFILAFSIESNPNSAFAVLERAMRDGDAKRICSFVEDKILMDINKQESVYSKSQAELILKDFFEKNRPKFFVVKTKSSSPGNLALLGTFTSDQDKSFRVSMKLRESASALFLEKLSISPI